MTFKITSSAQLMKNHVAGRALPAQRTVGLALDAKREPMLFSLDDAHLFQVSLRSDHSQSGWVQVDLGAQLPHGSGAPPIVEHFTVSQSPGGAIWIALSARAAGALSSTLYVSKALPGDADEADWASFGSHLLERPLPTAIVVEALSLGIGVGGNPTPLLVVEGTDANGTVHHVQVNPDPGDTNWSSEPIAMPQNATKCLAARPGYTKAHGLGVYTLCELGTRLNLTFTPLPQYFGGNRIMPPAVDMVLPGGANLKAIAPLTTSSLETELYVGGEGLHRFDVAAQASSNLPAETLDGGTYFDGVRSLGAQIDDSSGEVAIWGLAQTDSLLFVRGRPKSGGGFDWQTPLKIDTAVTAFAGLAASPTPSAPFAFFTATGYTDGALRLKTQDPLTKLWRTEQVSAATSEAVVAMETYTVRIKVVDADGFAAIDEDVKITPSFDCAARINGAYRMMATNSPIVARTTTEGTISIVLQTEALESPVFDLHVGTTTASVNPMDHIRTEIARYQTGQDVISATRTDGTPVFPKGLADSDADTVAKGLSKFGEVYDNLPSTHAQQPTMLFRYDAGAPRNVMMAMRRSACGTRLELLDETSQRPLAEAVGAAPAFLVSAGDMFAALAADVASFVSFSVEAVGAAFELVVDFGKRVLKLVFEIGAQVLNAVNWLMKEVLGFDLSDIVDWLGFVFDWGAVLQTKKVVSHMAALTMDHGTAQLQNLKTLVNAEAAKLRAQIKAAGGLTVDTSDQIFHDRIKNNPNKDDDDDMNPQASWAGDHMRSGLPDAVRGAIGVGTDVLTAMTQLATTEGKIIENAINQVMTDVVDQFDTLSIADVVKKVVAIVSEALLNSGENVVLTIIDVTEIIVETVKAIMTAHIEIPVITFVYEQIICAGDGSKLTLLDAMSLLVAAPASILYRGIVGAPLFSDADAKAILAAKDFNALLAAMTAMQAAAAHHQFVARIRPTMVLAATPSRTPGEHGMLVLQWLAVVSRAGSALAYGLKSISFASSGPKMVAADAKLCCDILTSSFGTIATFMKLAGTPSTSRSTRIDIAITWTTWIFRVRDGYYSRYYHKNGREVGHLTKTGLSFVESLFGISYVVMVVVAAVDQGEKGPPDFLNTKSEKAAWTAVLVGKVAQNVLGAVYRVASPGSELTDPKAKAIANIVRFACITGGAGLSLYRVIIETPYDFADLDF